MNVLIVISGPCIFQTQTFFYVCLKCFLHTHTAALQISYKYCWIVNLKQGNLHFKINLSIQLILKLLQPDKLITKPLLGQASLFLLLNPSHQLLATFLILFDRIRRIPIFFSLLPFYLSFLILSGILYLLLLQLFLVLNPQIYLCLKLFCSL